MSEKVKYFAAILNEDAGNITTNLENGIKKLYFFSRFAT